MTNTKTKICKSNFDFEFQGRGAYKVRYRSDITGKCTPWKYITEMTVIDKTKNAEYPLIKDLTDLKRLCKSKEW